MPLRILLAVLVALACPTSQAWATGPQFGPMSGGGGGVSALTCSAGDFFSAVDGSGNFTCSTPSAGSAAFSALTGSTNTTAAMVVGTGASLTTSGSGTIAATTSAALAANPTDCGADTYATTIDASGNLTCATVTSAGITNGAIVNADVNAAAAIDVSKTALVAGAGVLLSTNTLTTASDEADFLKSGALVCGAGTQGKSQVHTTPLQYCDNTATPTLRYAAYGSSTGVASTATALAANGANCSAGNAPLGVDASGAVEGCFAVDIFQTIDASSGTDPVADTTTDTLVMTGTAPVTVTGNSAADSVTYSLADVSDCSANQYVNAVGANLALSCAQPDHGNLAGLTDDDHSQYALLAGRSGGQTLIGGTASGDDLTLQSTSHATKGSLFLDDAVELWPNVPDSSTALTVMGFTADLDLDGAAQFHTVYRAGPTVHVGQASAILGSVSALRGDMTILHDDATSSDLPFVQLVWAPVTMTTSVAVAAPTSYVLLDNFVKRATGSITVPTGGSHYTVRALPSFKSISSASSTWTEYYGLSVAPAVGTDNGASDGTDATVTTMGAVKYTEVSFDSGAGTEAVTNQIVIDVPALSKATTNIGIRNADTTVYTPTTQTIAAASDTISPTASLVCLNATANRDLTSTPHISDGVSGQVLTVMNCDTSTETIKLNDQSQVANSGLQLTANSNVTLKAGESITLVYTAAGGASDWFEISRTADYQTVTSMVIASDVTQVNYFCGPGFDCNATETSVDVAIPTDITLIGLTCEQKDDASCTVDHTVRDDAANTAATCQTVNADVCNWSGSVSVAAGSMLALQLTTWTSCTNNSDIECAITYTRP